MYADDPLTMLVAIVMLGFVIWLVFAAIIDSSRESQAATEAEAEGAAARIRRLEEAKARVKLERERESEMERVFEERVMASQPMLANGFNIGRCEACGEQVRHIQALRRKGHHAFIRLGCSACDEEQELKSVSRMAPHLAWEEFDAAVDAHDFAMREYLRHRFIRDLDEEGVEQVTEHGERSLDDLRLITLGNMTVTGGDFYQTKKRRRKTIPSTVQKDVFDRDEGACVLCGSSQNLQYDHIIPHSKGGADTVQNLRVLCRDCNLSKGAGF